MKMDLTQRRGWVALALALLLVGCAGTPQTASPDERWDTYGPVEARREIDRWDRLIHDFRGRVLDEQGESAELRDQMDELQEYTTRSRRLLDRAVEKEPQGNWPEVKARIRNDMDELDRRYRALREGTQSGAGAD